jgi:hypothetical protein
MKPEVTGDVLVEDFVLDGCSSTFDGLLNATASGRTLTARNGIIRDIQPLWFTTARSGAFKIRDGGIVVGENILLMDSGVDHMIISASSDGTSSTFRHMTTINWAGPRNFGTGPISFTDCADMGGGSGLTSGWTAGTGALDNTGPDYDNGTGKLGYGLRPNAGDNWATGGSQNPATDLEGTTRPASSALGALEPT